MNVYTTCEFDHDRIVGCSIGNSVCMYGYLFWESKSVLCNFCMTYCALDSLFLSRVLDCL